MHMEGGEFAPLPDYPQYYIWLHIIFARQLHIQDRVSFAVSHLLLR